MKLLRFEYIGLFILSVLLSAVFYKKIVLWQFLLLFFAIDIIGYYPGRIWSLINHNEKPPQVFYTIYNIVHNLFVLVILSLVWFFFFDENYSFLALFVHIFIDRGVLGNFPKVLSDDFKTPSFHKVTSI